MSKSKDSLFKRLTRLFRSGPLVKRKIRTTDTVVASPDKLTSSGMSLFQKSTSPTYANITANAYNLSERLMRYQDYNEMEQCLQGSTLIATPESPSGFKRIDELAAECSEESDKQFIVYSYDHHQRKIVPALGKQARQTCVDHAWRVTFDNGKEIVGTSEHRLMLRDGTYCKIQDLKSGMAVMPGRDISQKESIDVEKFKKNYSALMKQNNLAARKDVTFGRILEICERVGFRYREVLKVLDVSEAVIHSRLRDYGFNDFSTFAKAYHQQTRVNKTVVNSCENSHVVSVEYVGIMPLFDLTVDGYKNFATDSVISHNTPELSSALDIFAAETLPSDEKGKILHVFSNDAKIKTILDDLFYSTLNIEFNGPSWVRNLVKYGDHFIYIDVSQEYGVVNAFPIPVNEIEREEGYDRNDPFAVRFKWLSLGNRTLENWEVGHFRLLGNDLFLPYGSSVIESARRVWRQLILIEDAMLVYRITRAPERRVFYIDVGNMPPESISQYIEEARKTLRTQGVADNTTGRVDLRYNPMSVDEDFWLPVRGTESGTKIDNLPGGQNAAAIEDVEYIQRKLFAAIKIPRAYLGYEDALSSKSTLAQQDIRFSRTISTIQKTVIAELNKIAIIHLFANGYDGDDLTNFSLRLSNPSTVAQQQKLELWRAKFDIAANKPEMMTDEFVQKEIFGLNNSQIKYQENRRMHEAMFKATLEASGEQAASGGGGGGGSLFGGGGGSTPEPDFGGDETDTGEEIAAEPSTEPETPEEPLEAGEEPGEEPIDDDSVELLLAVDKQNTSKVKLSPHSKRAHDEYTRQRQQDYRNRNSGSKPNINNMLTQLSNTKSGAKRRSTDKDIFGQDEFRQVSQGKFESFYRQEQLSTLVEAASPSMTTDIVSMLSQMESTFLKRSNMLNESSEDNVSRHVFIEEDE